MSSRSHQSSTVGNNKTPSPPPLPPPPALGNFDLPANPHTLFRVTLNSDELFTYLRKLGEEVQAQSRYATSVVEEMNMVRSEMQALKTQTRNHLNEFSSQIKVMENGMGATVSEAQFRTTINFCQKQILNLGQMLDMSEEDLCEGAGMPGLAASTFRDGGSPGRGEGRSTTKQRGGGEGSSNDASQEGDGSPTQNLSAPNVAKMDGRSTSTGGGNAVMKKDSSTSPRTPSAQDSAASPSTSSKIGKAQRGPRENEGGIRGLITKEINEWYKSRGLADAKVRHDVTIATAKAQVAEARTELEQGIRAAVADLVSLPYLKETLDNHLALTSKTIGTLSKEQERLRKNQSQFQAKIRSNVNATIRRVSEVSITCSKRISRFYAMMSLPEPVVPGEEEEDAWEGGLAGGGVGNNDSVDWSDDESHTGSTTHASVRDGGEGASPSSGVSSSVTTHHHGVEASVGGESVERKPPTQKRDVGVDGAYFPMGEAIPFPPPPEMGRKAPKGAMTASTTLSPSSRQQHKPSTTGNDASAMFKPSGAYRASTGYATESAYSEGGMDATTSTVIQSPVFVAFRQHVLNDISERIASARSTQSSDIDVELLALRNDIRHRVTSSRVVELIKQYSDTETPHRVTQLFRLVKELEGDKVSAMDLNDGLRSKADAHYLDTKASIDYVDNLVKRLTQKLDALQADLSLLIADRKEYRDVVQQLLVQSQSAPFRSCGIVGRAQGGMFPNINAAVAAGGEDSTADMAMEGAATATRNFTGGKHPGGLVPLTELLHARNAGGPMMGSIIHSPSPPLPLLHRPEAPNTQIGGSNSSPAAAASIEVSPAREDKADAATVSVPNATTTPSTKAPQPPDRVRQQGAPISPSLTYPISRQTAESAPPIPFSTPKSSVK